MSETCFRHEGRQISTEIAHCMSCTSCTSTKPHTVYTLCGNLKKTDLGVLASFQSIFWPWSGILVLFLCRFHSWDSRILTECIARNAPSSGTRKFPPAPRKSTFVCGFVFCFFFRNEFFLQNLKYLADMPHKWHTQQIWRCPLCFLTTKTKSKPKAKTKTRKKS